MLVTLECDNNPLPTQPSDCAEQGISAANAPTLCLPGAFACLFYVFPIKAADEPQCAVQPMGIHNNSAVFEVKKEVADQTVYLWQPAD